MTKMTWTDSLPESSASLKKITNLKWTESTADSTEEKCLDSQRSGEVRLRGRAALGSRRGVGGRGTLSAQPQPGPLPPNE